MDNLSDTDIQLYIEKRLSREELTRVANRLKESHEDFQRYVRMKEALYLKRSGKKPTIHEKRRILSLLPSGRPHLEILLTFLADSVVMSTSDKDSLEYHGLEARFQHEHNRAGPVSLTRSIDNRDVTFKISPEPENKGFKLAVFVEPADHYAVSLILNDKEVEAIADLKNQNSFNSTLPRSGDLSLFFRKQGETVFTVGFTLKTD